MALPMIDRSSTTGTAPTTERPRTVTTDVCTEIRAAHERFAAALEEFLSQPWLDELEGLRAEGGRYLDFERRVILPYAASVAATSFQVDELRDNHDRLLRAFNIVLWDLPGSVRLLDDARSLREVFRQQVALFDRAVCPDDIDLRD